MPITRSEFQLHIGTTADTGGVDKAGISTHELREAIRLAKLEAGNMLGPLGELTHFLSNPYMLAIAGATLAIKMLAEQHKATREEIVKQIQASQELSDVWRTSQLASLEKLADATAYWNRKLLHARDSIDLLAEASQRELTHIREVTAEQNAQAASANILAEALIRVAQAAGLMTGPEANVALDRLREQQQVQAQLRHDAELAAQAEEMRRHAIAASTEAHAAAERIPGERAEWQRADEARRHSEDAVAAAKAQKPELERKETNAVADIAALEQEWQSRQFGAYELAEMKKALKRGDVAGAAGFTSAGFVHKYQEAQGDINAAVANRSTIEKQEALAAQFTRQAADIQANIDANERLKEAQEKLTRELMQQSADIEAQRHVNARTDDTRNRELEDLHRVNEFQPNPSDMNIIGGAASQTGPEAALGANAAITRARIIEQHVRTQRPQDRTPDEMAELHGVLESITGYLENHSAAVNSQRGVLQDIQRRLQGLEVATSNGR